MKTSAILILLSGLFCTYTVLADNASSSTSAAKRETECVYSDQIAGWNVLDSRHVLIWAPMHSDKDAYLLTLITPLSDTTVTMRLAFVDKDHDGQICGRSSDGVAVPDTGMHTVPSVISGMHRVDAAELQQLSEKYQVNLASRRKVAKSSAGSSASVAKESGDRQGK